MPDQASESPKVQYIYGGRGGRGGEMGGAGGLGGGPAWDYGISAQTFTMINHWHLSSAPPEDVLNTDLDERDCPDQQPPVEQFTASLGPDQVRSQYSGGGARGHRINDHAPVPMPVRKPTFNSLIHERLAADQTRSNSHLLPNDTTIPFAMPIPAPSVDDPILEGLAADHNPHPFPLSPAPHDDAVPTMPLRKPTFD
ncbi:hypothetical protein B0H19DRAFT_1238204 [Mycena capillaripes]|nr:hypothetical protein B0H19DRAFT_1238204 [Mycena capillaripes]